MMAPLETMSVSSGTTNESPTSDMDKNFNKWLKARFFLLVDLQTLLL